MVPKLSRSIRFSYIYIVVKFRNNVNIKKIIHKTSHTRYSQCNNSSRRISNSTPRAHATPFINHIYQLFDYSEYCFHSRALHAQTHSYTLARARAHQRYIVNWQSAGLKYVLPPLSLPLSLAYTHIYPARPGNMRRASILRIYYTAEG